MGTKNNPGDYDCYAKAEPDEPMFVLLARDPLAATTVRGWAINLQNQTDMGILPKEDAIKNREKVQEAYKCADDMEKWRADYLKRDNKPVETREVPVDQRPVTRPAEQPQRMGPNR